MLVENIAEAPPVSKGAEPASDGEQADEVPGLSRTDLVPAVLVADAPVPEHQEVVSEIEEIPAMQLGVPYIVQQCAEE